MKIISSYLSVYCQQKLTITLSDSDSSSYQLECFKTLSCMCAINSMSWIAFNLLRDLHVRLKNNIDYVALGVQLCTFYRYV